MIAIALHPSDVGVEPVKLPGIYLAQDSMKRLKIIGSSRPPDAIGAIRCLCARSTHRCGLVENAHRNTVALSGLVATPNSLRSGPDFVTDPRFSQLECQDEKFGYRVRRQYHCCPIPTSGDTDEKPRRPYSGIILYFQITPARRHARRRREHHLERRGSWHGAIRCVWCLVGYRTESQLAPAGAAHQCILDKRCRRFNVTGTVSAVCAPRRQLVMSLKPTCNRGVVWSRRGAPYDHLPTFGVSGR